MVGIESQQTPHTVTLHRGHKPSIVGGLAFDVMIDDQAFPLLKDPTFVTEQGEKTLELSKFVASLGGRHSKAVFARGASCDNPELVDVLRHDVQILAAVEQEFHGVSGVRVVGMIGLQQTGQDVRIQERAHSPRPS